MTRDLSVRPGVYHDSVALMQVSRSVADEPGVNAALVAMATPLNVDLAAGMGFTAPDGAGPNDLMIAIDAADDDALARARAIVEAALAGRRAQATQAHQSDAGPQPRTLGSAVERSDATVAFVATPGPHAFVDAMDALLSDVPVVVFSDNVSVADEVRLKQAAQRRGLLVMGPDCGTAVISGVGFGFANVVRPGPVGIVAASGTGAQQLMSLLDASGAGISHCLGVGGRDMSDEVGALSTLTALDMLAADPATEVIVVVGKPPGRRAAEQVHEHAATLTTPVLFAMLGPGQPDLTAAARSAVETLGMPWQEPRSWAAPDDAAPTTPPAADVAPRYVRGLFSGGTLCDEAMAVVAAELGPVYSNIPLRPEWSLGTDLQPMSAAGVEHHVMVDFGDDALTLGRPHPMIDGSLRAHRMLAEALDPTCGVLLLDVVLGHGAHPDPAAELARVIAECRTIASRRGRELPVVVSLIGTAGDPQDLDRQAEALNGAGASVHLSNAAAAREAVRHVVAPSSGLPPTPTARPTTPPTTRPTPTYRSDG
ncbi:FdrA family protein [Phytoactinopolyspora halotolerans]|uniref:FdrA family protein n=1 Tax=Phytoactinopolyspora halotolerans TaxID=1981512 RepID=A0A6L9SA56_9ACTN|nr:FdrA family protein [Phytoactinopolyspora halotolerans]NEE02136.1 FdrA family protein [Phytoactinopolyspora halotolerans]